EVVIFGNDPTHPKSPLGAFSFEVGKLFWLAGEYARQHKLDFIYWPWTSGAQMGLPEELIPKKPGMPLRISWDFSQNRIYLTKEDVNAVVQAMHANSKEDIFVGEWNNVEGEDRLYPRAILKGGINQLSLRGSALAGGAMARLAASVPT